MNRVLVAALVLALCASALGNWNDGFEPYTLGPIDGQGGWQGWGGDSGATGFVTDLMARTGTQSQEVYANSDSVHQYSGYTEGQWVYTAYQYIPSDLVGNQHFILLNNYSDPSGPFNWSVQISFDPTTGNLSADCGSSTPVVMPYVADQWIAIEAYIDLDADWVQVYYNGTLLDDPALAGEGYQWTTGVFGGDTDGLLNIAAVDLYAGAPQTPESTSVYYDDMSLVPEPATVVLLLGVVAVLRRR
ncbi:MAG: hypothetical protein PVJ57_16260 [Phycisphaerae bacterium]|jgi:hypothetical protein